MPEYVVAGVRIDRHAHSHILAGSVRGNYLFGFGRYGDHAVAWNFPVILKSGTNRMTLDQSNGGHLIDYRSTLRRGNSLMRLEMPQ
jgi:hypothetical protein